MTDIRTVPWDVLNLRQRRSQGSEFVAPAASRLELPSAQQRVITIPPPWQVKPPCGEDFYFNVEGQIAAGAASQLILTDTPTLTILDGYEAVIAGVTIFVDAPTTDFDVRYFLRVNQGSPPGTNLRSFSRTANNLSIGFPFQIIAPSNASIDVLTINQNVFGPWDIGVEVSGWQWPVVYRKRFFGDDDF